MTKAPEAVFPDGESPPASNEARQQERSSTEKNYQAFYRERGFGADVASRFTELMTDLILEGSDRIPALKNKTMMHSADQSPATWQIAAEVVQEQEQRNRVAAIEAKFGTEVASALKRYLETMPVRGVTNQLASALFYSDAPLSAAQADQLVEIMGRNARTPAGKLIPAAIDKERTLAEAQSVLSAPQLEALAAQIDQVKWRSGTLR